MNNRNFTLAAAGILLTAGAIGTTARPSFADETVVTRYHHVHFPNTGEIRVMVNGQPVQFDAGGPIMVDGSHVFVPIRGVFEQMGGNVDWHPDQQVVEGARPGHMFRIKVGSTDAVVNGAATELPTPPKLMDGTTYVPLRFASEALGAHVRWDSDKNTVFIRTHDGDDNASSDTGNTGTYERKSVIHDPNGDTTTIIHKSDNP